MAAIHHPPKGSAPWYGGPRMRIPGTGLISKAARCRPIRGRTTTFIARPATTPRSRSSRSALTAVKAAAAVQQTYAPASNNQRRRAAQRGVILLDLVIAVALLSLLILLVLPSIS